MLTRPGRLAMAGGAGLLAAALSSLLSASPSQAHGYTSSPASRAYMCNQGKATDCGPIQYEPQSLEGPKGFPTAGPADGHICSAGKDQYHQLDDPRGGKWPTTPEKSGGAASFTWHLTAQHSTASFDYYLTNASYDPAKPLTRSEIDTKPFLSVPMNGAKPPADVTHKGTLPSGRKGKAMVVAVWTIADTNNAFYQCSDIDFGAGAAKAAPKHHATHHFLWW